MHISLPLFIDGCSFCIIMELREDEPLQHITIGEVESSVIHRLKDCIGILFRICFNLYDDDIIDDPIHETFKSLTLKIVRKTVLYVIIAVCHKTHAILVCIFWCILIVVIESIQTILALRYLDIKGFLSIAVTEYHILQNSSLRNTNSMIQIYQ